MTVEKLNDRMGKLVAFLVYPTMLVLVYEVMMRYAFGRPTLSWAGLTPCGTTLSSTWRSST